ncbi:uncharacterized protein FIBRA_07828 [Fibroporia radiculosa]|uniref:NAD(P)-binding protein n=1 Tax=Fibroporia radiculosa TaxID=599839 RepID=J4GVP2_9APHY|nr:uncharacterized protein FIBRA_07828 [Fibroporia radiculosa]CCM05600.1 predicted protein [Fibroporia radiculosa]
MYRVTNPTTDWTADRIPDLAGRTIIVTGGNVGIGYETIKALLQRNAKVYMASRSRQKAVEAISQLKNETGKEAIFLELDLSSLASCRKAAEEFLRKETELHVLFNNAGVMVPPIDMVSADGYDLQFGTNVVGHFLFTELLLPALRAATQSSVDHHARVITTSSSGAMICPIDWDTLKDGPARRKKSINLLYAQSKFVSTRSLLLVVRIVVTNAMAVTKANVVVARELAKRFADENILSISVDPGTLLSFFLFVFAFSSYPAPIGAIRTELQRHSAAAGGIMGWFSKNTQSWLRPASFGALTQLWAGTTPEALNFNGKYFVPTAREAKCRAEAYDDDLGQKLWQWLQKETGTE